MELIWKENDINRRHNINSLREEENMLLFQNGGKGYEQ